MRELEVELKNSHLILGVVGVPTLLFLLGYAAGSNNCREPFLETSSNEQTSLSAPLVAPKNSLAQAEKNLETFAQRRLFDCSLGPDAVR